MSFHDGNSVAIKDNRWFSLYVRYSYSDGTYEYKSVKFNPHTYGAQSVTGAVYPSESKLNLTVTNAYFYVLYYRQLNSIFLDDLQMTFDETGIEYTYDDNGNTTKAIDHLGRVQEAAYNSNQLVTSQMNYDNTRETYTYTTDFNNRLIKTQRLRNSGNETSYEYDSNGNTILTKTYDTNTNGTQNGSSIETGSTYDSSGNYVTQSRDQRDKLSNFTYDNNRGTLTQSTDPNGNIQKYTYDPNNNQTKTVTAVDKNNQSTVLAKNEYQYNSKGYLDKILSGTSGEQEYSFVYDVYGNQKQVKVGIQTLITNQYKVRNGDLEKATYGNGDYVDYTYDLQHNIKTVSYNGASPSVSNSYDKQNRLVTQYDNENGVVWKYYYDAQSRLTKVEGNNGTKIQTAFDNSIAKANKKIYNIAGERWEILQTYSSNNENAPAITTLPNRAISQNHYDDLMRVWDSRISRNGVNFRNEYTFYDVNSSRTTTLPKTLSLPDYQQIGSVSNGKTLEYVYDNNGNITQIKENGIVKSNYSYDQLGQLTADNSTQYTYDSRGNILTKGNNTYTYGDSNWKDKLTSFNGKSITYDEIGNPLTYDGWNYTWAKGRQLRSMSKSGSSLSFKYDSAGLRTQKTVNGTTTKYHYDGTQLVAMQTGTQTPIYFYYNANGKCVYFKYQDSGFYYVYNLQGDVIALTEINNNVHQTVCEYNYDAWGNMTITTNPAYTKHNPALIAEINPFRYRGYFYDTETNLYYLQSRYYNPEFGRFINADGLVQTGQGILDKNMFAYCENNPITRVDYSGMFWRGAVSGVATAKSSIFGAGSSNVFQATQEEELAPVVVNTIISVKKGTAVSTTTSKAGDSSKPVSVYAKGRSDNYFLSSVGLKINISNFTLNISLGLDNIGISGSIRNGNTTSSIGIRSNISQFKVGIEGSTTVKWDENKEVTEYLNVSQNMLTTAALCVVVIAGPMYFPFVLPQTQTA